MTDQNLSSLIGEGRKHLDRGDFQGAIARFEQAVDQARAWGETENELIALGWLPAAWGSVANHHKEVEAATRLLARARELRREDYELVATLRMSEAIADLDLRRHWHEIKPLLSQGLETSRRLGKGWYELYHTMLLGIYAVRVGDTDDGHAWLQQALNSLHPDIEQSTVPRCLFRFNIYTSLSRIMSKRGEHSEALRYAEMVLGLAKEEHNPAYIAEAQITLARTLYAKQDVRQAYDLVQTVLPQARQRGWKGLEHQAEYMLGELERELAQPDSAEVAARRAYTLAQEMQLCEEEVQALISLGRALLAQQRHQEAKEIFAQARRLSQERDYTDYFEQAETLLNT